MVPEKNRPAAAPVAVIDPDAAGRGRVRHMLQALPVEVREYASASEFLGDLRSAPVCLIARSQLPDMTAAQMLHQLHRQKRRVPAILLAEESEVEAAVEAMRAGALDFVESPQLPRALKRHLEPLLVEPSRVSHGPMHKTGD